MSESSKVGSPQLRRRGILSNQTDRVHRRLHQHHHETRELFPSRSIVKRILSYVDLTDLLDFRLVSKSWNELICETNPVTNPPSLLWTKARLVYTARKPLKDNNHHLSENREKISKMIETFQAFGKISLVTRFHSPNYHLRLLDARFEIVRNFFQDNGHYIENLRLDNCIMSLVSFQRIIQSCPNLIHFEICGMFHCINHVESLSPIGDPKSLSGFFNLRSLCFESSYVNRYNKYIGKKARMRNMPIVMKPGWNEEPDIQDLNSTLIQEILLAAAPLEKLSFDGFGMSTVSRTLHVLSQHPIHGAMKDLRFTNIPDAGSSTCLCDLHKLNHMKLRKFYLTFLQNPNRNFLYNNDEKNGEDNYENLDEAVRNFLILHHPYLEELNFTNCNITDLIFLGDEFTLPMLKELCLVGTEIRELTENMDKVLHAFWEYQLSNRLGGDLDSVSKYTQQQIDEIMEAIYREIFEWEAAMNTRTNAEERDLTPMDEGVCGFYTCSMFDFTCLAWIGIVGIFGFYAFLTANYGDSANFIAICIIGGVALIYILYALWKTMIGISEN